MQKINIKIGDLFKKLDIDAIDKLINVKGIYIRTPSGELTPVLGLIKKSPKDIYEYEFSNGVSIRCSDEHLIQHNSNTKKIGEASSIDTIEGEIKKVKTSFVKNDFVYDISITSPHLYVTPNGVIHHNTSIVHSIIKDLNADVKWINGSQDRGIDTFKVSVKEFITSVSIDDSPKIVVIDECLEENERIKTKDGSIRLKDMQIGAIYDCLSVNKNTLKVEEDTCEVISTKEAEVFEIEMTDGRTITLTADHPVMVKTSTGVIKKSISEGLNEDDEIVDFLELKTEENQDCGVEVTVKFSTEHAKILEDSNINKEHLLRGFLDVIIAEQTKKQTKKADEKAA